MIMSTASEAILNKEQIGSKHLEYNGRGIQGRGIICTLNNRRNPRKLKRK